MKGCDWNKLQCHTARPNCQRTTHWADVRRQHRRIACAVHRQNKFIDLATSGVQFAQRRGAEATVAVALLLACGSALPPTIGNTTASAEELTPVLSKSLDRHPVMRWRHTCMPQLPASNDFVDAQDGLNSTIVSEQVQASQRLQERLRAAPPACGSSGGGDIVLRPQKPSQTQLKPRFASNDPQVAGPMTVPLTVAILPSVVHSLAEQLPLDATVPGKYVPSPMEVGWQIYVGSAVATFPFVLGAYEFGKRILIQRRCENCSGIGLVKNTQGTKLLKCSECGGFFPWLGWKTFFTSTASPGNGGPLMQPKGQTSVLYKVPPIPSKAAVQQSAVSSGSTTEASEDSSTVTTVRKQE